MLHRGDETGKLTFGFKTDELEAGPAMGVVRVELKNAVNGGNWGNPAISR